ncbi:MAG: hypothetical protein R2751_14180 [Bacteroidales bacterium]
MAFVLFVFSGPMVFLATRGFRHSVDSSLNPARKKQLRGLLGFARHAGTAGGVLLTGWWLGRGLSFRHALFLSLGALACAGLAHLLRHYLPLRQMDAEPAPVRSSGPLHLFAHKYTATMSLFVVLGIGSTLFLNYIFLWSAEGRFHGRDSLAGFLGLFYGVLIPLAWLGNRYAFSRIKQRFDLGVALLLSPVLLFLVSVGAGVAGERLNPGSLAMTYPLFGVLIFAGKAIHWVLHESLGQPAMALVYRSLDPVERRNVELGIEGVLSQVAVFSSGLLLALVVSLSNVEVIHVNYLLSLCVLGWFFSGMALYREYRKVLKNSFSGGETDRYRMNKLLHFRPDPFRSVYALETIRLHPWHFHDITLEDLRRYLDHPRSAIRELGWRQVHLISPGMTELELSQRLAREENPEIKDLIRDLRKRRLRSKPGLQEEFIRERLHRFGQDHPESDPGVSEAFASGDRNEVFAAMYHVAENGSREYNPQIMDRIKDPDPGIRAVAMATAARLHLEGVASRIQSLLREPGMEPMAWSALVQLGDACLDDLDATFHKPGTDILLQKRILSILSAIGSEKACRLLLDKLDYHHRDVFSEVVHGLFENGFQANRIQNASVQNSILRLVHTGAWNLAAVISLRTGEPAGKLMLALDSEIRELNDQIFMLLSLIYDRESVWSIRQNLMGRSRVDKEMGLEMLNLLVSEPLRAVVHAYFHDVVVREKLDKLNALFALEVFPPGKLLTRILNRDGMLLGDFIRICVLDFMGRTPAFFNEQQIIAQGFHPNPNIRETAAEILRRSDPGRFSSVHQRFEFADHFFMVRNDPSDWLMDTTIGLNRWGLFANVGLNTLLNLASKLHPFRNDLPGDGEYVVLARSETPGTYAPLSAGLGMIISEHPEIMEQIRYLWANGTCEAYLIELEVFVEMLFDNRGLLHVFCAFLAQGNNIPA